MTMNLSPDLVQFINDRVAAGSYPTEEAVLRAAFGLLEKREQLLARIDRGTEELRRGDSIKLESDEDWDRFFEDIKQRGTERNRREGRV